MIKKSLFLVLDYAIKFFHAAKVSSKEILSVLTKVLIQYNAEESYT